jgi:peptide/nickel transport system substrate-binding protein
VDGGLYEPSFLTRDILGEGFNSARYSSDEKLTQLLNDQLTEMDAQKRKEMVFQIQELFATDLPSLCLYYPTGSYWAYDNTVEQYFTMDGVAIGVPIALNRMSFVK